MTRRIDIARHWAKTHAPAGLTPSRMGRALFVENFGDVFEHSPWVAEGAHATGLSGMQDSADGLHAAMVEVMRAAEPERQLALIRAHPDLAGRVAAADLAPESRAEQASAGLDALDEEGRARFLDLNERYLTRHGFPFVMAVRGKGPEEILSQLAERLDNPPEAERARALAEIETIALLRLRQRLPSLPDVFSATA